MPPATWRTPALIVAAGCLIALLSFGVRAGFGLFLTPMSSELGWGREVFALAIAIQNLLWGAGQPFAGALADRFGCGRVLAAGGTLYAAGLVMMAHAGTPVLPSPSCWPRSGAWWTRRTARGRSGWAPPPARSASS